MQCRAGVGACPDTMDSSGTCTNDVTDVTGFVRDGQQCVAFTRPFSTSKRLVTADSLLSVCLFVCLFFACLLVGYSFSCM